MQHDTLTTEEVWAEVKAVAYELYEDYVEQYTECALHVACGQHER